MLTGTTLLNTVAGSGRMPMALVLSLVFVLLTSCAGGEVKTEKAVDTGSMKPESQYVQVDPDVELDFKGAIALMKQQQYAQAAVVLKSVVAREQRLPAPYVNLAMAQKKLGQNEEAEQNLIKALKLDIGHPVANNELGLLYRRQGRFKAARVAYENAIKAHPDYLPAKRNLGVLCDLYLHDFECALEQFEDYLELKPEDKTMAIWVADVKRRLGR